MIFSFFYNTLLLLMTLVLFPKWGFDALFKKKYRQSWLERIGWKTISWKSTDRRTAWFHAVSLGETKAIASLVQRFHQAHPDWLIIISSGTETGHAEAMRTIPYAEKHFYLPLDFSWVMKKLFGRVRPSLVVLSEGDLWYHFLYYAKMSQAKVAIVNAKLSERSLKRMRWASFFSARILKLIDLIVAQSRLYADRWVALGFPKEHLKVTGNLKFDGIGQPLSISELQGWRKKLLISPKDFVVTLGSTHAPEEIEFLQQMKIIWNKFPDAKVIIVPRHPERFDEVERIIQKENISYCRYTGIEKQIDRTTRIILLDAMGLLQVCYQLSEVAVVGGSYVSHVGGHNILEPCVYGVPVLFGPYMHAQPEMASLAHQFQAGKKVAMNKLGFVIIGLLKDEERRKKIGQCGKKLIEQQRGATERTWQLIRDFFSL